MHKKIWLVLTLAAMLLSVSACGSRKSKESDVTAQGYPTAYAKEREQIFSIMESEENKIPLTVSGGTLTEAIGGDKLFIYSGDMKESKPDGYGIVFDPYGGLLFGGEFEKGKPSGYGIVFSAYDYRAHPDIYEGDDCSLFSLGGLQKFQASGEGFIYKGFAFSVDEPHIIYEGELDKNDRDGTGCEYYVDESDIGFGPLQYEGKFKDDELSGEGTLYDESGALVYEGEFRNDSFHGKGTLYDSDGSVRYEGKFKNGEIKS